MKFALIAFLCLLIGFLLGMTVRSQQDKLAIQLHGVHSGYKSGLHDAATSISQAFGTYDHLSSYSIVFDAGPHSVIAVETSGVKTIRYYE